MLVSVVEAPPVQREILFALGERLGAHLIQEALQAEAPRLKGLVVALGKILVGQPPLL